MSNIPITSLPITNPLTGEETVPIVQAGTTKRTTTGAISALPFGQGSTFASGISFITVSSSFTLLPSSRVLAGASPVTLTDGGTSAPITIGFATGTAGYVLTANGTSLAATFQALPTFGTVTSVGLSGGTTGLTISNSPITTNGTMTIGGVLAVPNGGTGTTTIAANRVLIGASGSSIASIANGTAGSVLTSTGAASAPTFQFPGTGTVGGTASAITLTTGLGLTSLIDQQEFIFTPTGTVVGALPTLAVDSVAAKNIKSVDGYSFSVNYNIQQSKPLRVRYLSGLDVFTIVSPPTQFEDTPFGHGTVKLQASTGTALGISQEDGQGLLMWNSATSAFRMVRLDSIVTAGSLFSGNTTFVTGVANQNLAANKLYAIYVNNTDPTNQNATRLEAWEFYSGVGVTAWSPVINEIGIYVKPTVAGGSVADNTRTYVGVVWTASSDISNEIASAASMGVKVFSHFAKNRWVLGYQTTVVSNVVATSTLTTQSTPAVLATTEGITDSPRFDAQAQVTGDTAGAVASLRISVNGTSFNGSPFAVTSPTSQATIPSAGAIVHLTAKWESAPPIGAYTARTDIAISVGTATFATDILGHLSQ